MQFTAKQADLLKAIKFLQSQAARDNHLAYISDVQCAQHRRTISWSFQPQTRKITIDAEVTQAGAVILPVRRLSEVIRAGEYVPSSECSRRVKCKWIAADRPIT